MSKWRLSGIPLVILGFLIGRFISNEIFFVVALTLCCLLVIPVAIMVVRDERKVR